MIIKKVEDKGTQIVVTLGEESSKEYDLTVTCSLLHVWVVNNEKNPFVKSYDLKEGMKVNMPLA